MGSVLGIALRAKPRAAMQPIDRVEVSVEHGLAGDFRGAQKGRQVTVLSQAAWQRACSELGADLPWTTRRANLFVEDFEFSAKDLGKTLRIGEVELIVSEETNPCSRMDEQHAGLTVALEPDWRGGVCCDVIVPGAIKVGDRVEFT